MIHVVGIDPSLSGTGVVRFREDYANPVVKLIGSTATSHRDVSSDDPVGLLDRRQRLSSLAARIVRAATEGYDPEHDERPLFVIEGPLYNAPMKRDEEGELRPIPGGGHAHDRAGLWWLIVHHLWKTGYVVEVATGSMKMYATGSGRPKEGKKIGVLAYAHHNFPQLQITNDNEADALALCAMGARHLGFPLEPSVQRVTPRGMNAAKWPTKIERRN